MSTLSVPLSPDLEKFIDNQVKIGRASNKAEVVRRALITFAEDEAVFAVLEAEREVKEGKILRGDLRQLAKKIAVNRLVS
ncbi:type II toxin-antitoxin system ParD family antitoxin [Candidatus Azambacteria bacterium]|nr:type II toxin-antitoxin system ParD family antitoxin [Candidatus Azambacteria bacterium]